MGKISDVLKTLFTKSTSVASTSARIPMLNASGEPIGSNTVSKLASILGVDGFGFGHKKGEAYSSNYSGVIKLGDDKANVEMDIRCENSSNQPVPDISVRSKYNNVTGDWHSVLLDVPSFYKDYANLPSLASALGVRHFGVIVAGNSVTFNRNGIIFIDISGGGSLMIIANLYGRYIMLHDKDRSTYNITITKSSSGPEITLTPENYQISGFFMPFDL